MAACTSLSEVLNEIWVTALPISEKRRMCWFAVAAAYGQQIGTERGAVGGNGDVDCSSIADLQEAMAIISDGAGHRMNRPLDVVYWLRNHSLNDPSKRFSKLAKRRNLNGHPDVRLIHDLRDAMSAYESTDVAGSDSGCSRTLSSIHHDDPQGKPLYFHIGSDAGGNEVGEGWLDHTDDGIWYWHWFK